MGPQNILNFLLWQEREFWLLIPPCRTFSIHWESILYGFAAAAMWHEMGKCFPVQTSTRNASQTMQDKGTATQDSQILDVKTFSSDHLLINFCNRQLKQYTGMCIFGQVSKRCQREQSAHNEVTNLCLLLVTLHRCQHPFCPSSWFS